MNKKLLIACAICLLAIGGFTIYTVVNTKQIEEEQTALSNDVQAKKEVAATPVANEKNDQGEYVNGEPDEAIKVADFFNKCMQYTFNIEDTSNISVEVTAFQKENFSEQNINTMKEFYTGYKTIELIDCKIKSVKETTMTAIDGTKYNGYAVEYTASIKIQNGNIETFEEDRQYAIALVSFKDGKMLLRNFDAQTK